MRMIVFSPCTATFLFTISILFAMLQTSKFVHCHTSLAAVYPLVPHDMEVHKVLVIHRHGDRSQISKTLGTKYLMSDEVTSIWNSRLPTERTCRSMLLAADPGDEQTVNGDKIDIKSTLYAGWDKINFPYAQLTEVGANQMMDVGKEMRRRYLGTSVLSQQSSDIHRSVYCRSTTMCRTAQSLRSLLAGLCDVDPDQHGEHITPAKLRGLPRIIRRSYEEETMYPQGGSEAMIERRKIIYPPELIKSSVANYDEFEAKVKETLGLPVKINWETVMEVLHCHSVHGVKYIEGLTAEDLATATHISAWHWGVLYKDKILNKLAIGRFLWDMMVDLCTAMGHSSAAALSRTGPSTQVQERTAAANKSMLIYSGHDSTLVPVLCALGLYDEKWPPYAAHLTLEVAASKVNPEQRYVRAVYNNQELPMFNSPSTWLPLEEFWEKLRSVACSAEEFAAECSRTGTKHTEDVEGKADIAITSKEVEEEVAATLGRNVDTKV